MFGGEGRMTRKRDGAVKHGTNKLRVDVLVTSSGSMYSYQAWFNAWNHRARSIHRILDNRMFHFTVFAPYHGLCGGECG